MTWTNCIYVFKNISFPKLIIISTFLQKNAIKFIFYNLSPNIYQSQQLQSETARDNLDRLLRNLTLLFTFEPHLKTQK
jgi:hypothetical protein